MQYRDAVGAGCTFCGGESDDTILGERARICRPCLELAHDVLRSRAA